MFDFPINRQSLNFGLVPVKQETPLEHWMACLAGSDSNRWQEDICKVYDSRSARKQNLPLSRAAQRRVFALRNFACEAIGLLGRAPNLLSPCREDECIDC
jgi:hypothetical protein